MLQNTTTGGSRNMVLGPRRVRRRFRMAGRLRPAEEGRLRRLRRPAFDDLVGRRCGGDEAILAAQDGPAILVGHSYGGVVITEAGNDPKVAGLVYIAAFVPDGASRCRPSIANAPPGVPVPPILVPQDGFLLLESHEVPRVVRRRRECRRGCLHGRLPGALGSRGPQRRRHGTGLRTKKPSWYLVAIEDKIDSARCAARHGHARCVDSRRSPRKSRRLRIETESCCTAHRAGGDRGDARDAVEETPMGTGGAPRSAVVAGGTGLVGGTLLQLLGADAGGPAGDEPRPSRGPSPARGRVAAW